MHLLKLIADIYCKDKSKKKEEEDDNDWPIAEEEVKEQEAVQ